MLWHGLIFQFIMKNEKKNYSYDIIKSDATIKIYQAKEKGYELGNVDSY